MALEEQPQGPVSDAMAGSPKSYTGQPQPILSGVTTSYGEYFGTMYELWYWADMLDLSDSEYLSLLEWRQGLANLESADNKAWSDILRATKKIWITDSAVASAGAIPGTAKEISPKRLPKKIADAIADLLNGNFHMFPGSELLKVEVVGGTVLATFMVDGNLVEFPVGSAADLAAPEAESFFPAHEGWPHADVEGDTNQGHGALSSTKREVADDYDHDAFLRRHAVGNQIRKPEPGEERPLPGNPGEGIIEQGKWILFGEEGYDPFLPLELLPLQMLGFEGRFIDTVLQPDPPIPQWDPEEKRYGSLSGDLNDFAHTLLAGIAVVTAAAGGVSLLTSLRRGFQFDGPLITEAELLDDLGIAPGTLAPAEGAGEIALQNLVVVGAENWLGAQFPTGVVRIENGTARGVALGNTDLAHHRGVINDSVLGRPTLEDTIDLGFIVEGNQIYFPPITSTNGVVTQELFGAIREALSGPAIREAMRQRGITRVVAGVEGNPQELVMTIE